MTTSCEFRFGLLDVTASADASFVVSESQAFADAADANNTDGITFPDVATLEPGFGWPLNGTKTILPADPGVYTWGWWSLAASGADGSFAVPPVLTSSFSDAGTPTPHSSAGITLVAYGTIPAAVNIKWYDAANAVMADEDFTPDALTYFCEKQVENYYKVVVTVAAMSAAYRFMRITSVVFGVLEIIGGSRVVNATLTEEVSPVALTLPINTLELDFFTAGGRFSLLDMTGAYAFFQWKQRIDAYKTVDGVKSFMGAMYFQTADGAVDAVTKLHCVDINGILAETSFTGGIYVNYPLTDLLDDVLGAEGVAYELDAAFAGVTITGYLPQCTRRQALQQIAFAIGAVPDPTRFDGVRLYPMPTITTTAILPARKIKGHSVKYEDLVTQVDVTAHSYSLSADLKELSKAVYAVGEHTIGLKAPASVTAITGATLSVTHVNYCIINVAAPGTVTLSGYEYKDSATLYTVKAAMLPAGAKASGKKFAAATLIDSSKAQAVAQRLYDYYQGRYTDEGLLLPGSERAGEKVSLGSLGGKTITGHIQRLVTDMSGGALETITMRGVAE